MLEVLTEDVEDDLQYEETVRHEAAIPLEISLHALSGVSTPQTMRVVGSIDGRKLHILIDSGSTHNFVNARFVVKLGCCKVPALGFRVNVANGEVLVCEATYPMVPMEIQGYRFEVRLYSLDLQGSDAVLSMQWLRSLGRVLHDWEKLTMEFTVANKQYLIRGDFPKGCMHGPVHSIQRLLSNGFEPFLMQMVAATNSDSKTRLDLRKATELDQLLIHYQAVFQVPTELPPV